MGAFQSNTIFECECNNAWETEVQTSYYRRCIRFRTAFIDALATTSCDVWLGGVDDRHLWVVLFTRKWGLERLSTNLIQRGDGLFIKEKFRSENETEEINMSLHTFVTALVQKMVAVAVMLSTCTAYQLCNQCAQWGLTRTIVVALGLGRTWIGLWRWNTVIQSHVLRDWRWWSRKITIRR